MVTHASPRCTLCPLHKISKVNMMYGVGPQPANILFVGEGPGEEEEKQGQPFMGPAGQLFEQLLTQAGIARSEVRVTSVVRCRPTDFNAQRTDRRGGVHYGNRPPTPEEVHTCAPHYLEEEIKATRPNVIVPVGNTALHYLAGEYAVQSYTPNADGTFTPILDKQIARAATITAERGVERWSAKYSCKIIPIIHPSALLRGARQINSTVDDLRRIKLASESKAQAVKTATQYVVVDNWGLVQWLLRRIKSVPELVIDVETTGFDWMRDRVFSLGFSWQEGTGASLRWLDEKGKEIWDQQQQTEIMGVLQDVFQDKTLLKIGHNLKFDIHHLLTMGLPFPTPLYDTMLAHHTLDSETDHGLKTLATMYTDMGGYEDALTAHFAGVKKADKDFMAVDRQAMGTYNAADCDCTLRLKHRFEKDMKKYPQMEQFFLQWHEEFIANVIMIEREGIPLDFDLLKDMWTRMGNRCAEIESSFRTQLGIQDFNLNSVKQLREIFFVKLGMTPIKHGKSGPSLDEEVLQELSKKYPDNKLMESLIEYRSLKKNMSTYLEGAKNSALFGRSNVPTEVEDSLWKPQEAIDKGYITDGRVHCDYLLHGTATGRLSCRNPNLQNIPRVTEADLKRGFVIRSIFKADPGYKLLAADLDQAELRVLQALSHDKALLDAMNSKHGVHVYFGTRLFNCAPEVVKEEKKMIAKMVVFGIVYGRQAQSIAEQFKIPLDKAQAYIDQFYREFPAAGYYLQQVVEEAKIKKYVVSAFGRVRHLPGIDSPNFSARLDAEHQAVNFPIQSPASDITQIAGAAIRKEILRLKLKARPVLTIHDDNTYHVPDDEVEILRPIVESYMQAYIPQLGVDMKCKIEITERWKVNDEDLVTDPLQGVANAA